jgi:hypothetical protein
MLHLTLVQHHSHAFVKVITVISSQSLGSHQWRHKSIATSLDYQWCHCCKTVMMLELERLDAAYFSALTFVNCTDGIAIHNRLDVMIFG